MNNSIYGMRAKIGLIYPSPGWVMEPEFYAMSPMGVATYTTRIPLNECNLEGCSNIGNDAVKAAQLLAQAPLDVIALGCTSGSFVGGKGYDLILSEKMQVAAGNIKCTTTATAVIAALNRLGLKKINVVTPYIAELNVKAKEFLEDHGFVVTQIKGLGLLRDMEIDRQDLETVYKLVKETDTKDGEGLLLLCTGLRTVPIISQLETDLGKPVISAVQATFWQCLRMAGVKDKITGYGSLLEIC